MEKDTRRSRVGTRACHGCDEVQYLGVARCGMDESVLDEVQDPSFSGVIGGVDVKVDAAGGNGLDEITSDELLGPDLAAAAWARSRMVRSSAQALRAPCAVLTGTCTEPKAQ